MRSYEDRGEPRQEERLAHLQPRPQISRGAVPGLLARRRASKKMTTPRGAVFSFRA